MKKQIKKKACAATAVVMMAAASVCAMGAPNKTAVPSDAAVRVEGQALEIGAYNIGGYNYFKLRDVAAAMNGTGAQFAVGYDAAAQSIALTADQAYTATGKELQDKPTENKTAAVSAQKILLDGKEVTMQAYLIDGYNYFQLRELGDKLGFLVGWDQETKTIRLTAEKESSSEVVEKEASAKADISEEEAVVYTAADLQKQIDEVRAKSDGSLYLTGTYKGTPGDQVYIRSSKGDFAIFGEDARIENITVVVDSKNPVWIEGVVFEGNQETENAVIIKNTITRSMGSGVVRCEIRNYLGDAVVIEGLEAWKGMNNAFLITETSFYEYGMDADRLNAAIAIRPTDKIKTRVSIMDNYFHLEEDPVDKEFADYAFATDNVPELLDEVIVLWENNEIQTGESFWDMDCDTVIPDANWK